jgi:hypothetical protein
VGEDSDPGREMPLFDHHGVSDHDKEAGGCKSYVVSGDGHGGEGGIISGFARGGTSFYGDCPSKVLPRRLGEFFRQPSVEAEVAMCSDSGFFKGCNRPKNTRV